MRVTSRCTYQGKWDKDFKPKPYHIQSPRSSDEEAIPLALDRPLSVTFFRNQFGKSKSDFLYPLRDLADEIKATHSASKETAPWLKIATFGSTKSPKGSYRSNANLQTFEGLEGDYDGEKVPMNVAADLCRKAGIAAMFYHTPSNSPEAPRWRVLCPCSTSLPPAEREKLMGWLNGVLKGILSPESFTLSQSFYFGNIEGRPPIDVLLVEGGYIDLATNLVDGAMGKGVKDADSGERVNDESRNAVAFREALAIYLSGQPIEAFAEWSIDNVWKDYERDPAGAVEGTWASVIEHCHEKGLIPNPPIKDSFEDETKSEEAKAKAKAEALRLSITATPFKIKGLAAIPQRQWLYCRSYARRLLSAVAATGGVGKSVLIIGEALAIATGMPILGESPPMGAKRVWHINSEDDKEELDRRFEAAIQHHEISQEDLGDRLYYTGNETRFIIANEDSGGLKIAFPLVAAIKAEIMRLRIDVLTIDPFVSTHTVSENSNDKINAVAGLWRDIAQECNCSVSLVPCHWFTICANPELQSQVKLQQVTRLTMHVERALSKMQRAHSGS